MAGVINPWLWPVVEREVRQALRWKSEASELPSGKLQEHVPWEDDGSNLRIRSFRIKPCVQILKFIAFQDPVKAILSDSATSIRATISSSATRCFEQKEHRHVTKETSGGIIQLLDFEVVATHLGDPRSRLTLLIKSLRYLGSAGSGTFGHPKPIESQDGIQDLLSQVRLLQKQEEPPPTLMSRVRHAQDPLADHNSDSAGQDHEREGDYELYMTQAPVYRSIKQVRRKLKEPTTEDEGNRAIPSMQVSCRDRLTEEWSASRRPSMQKRSPPERGGRDTSITYIASRGNSRNNPADLLRLLNERHGATRQKVSVDGSHSSNRDNSTPSPQGSAQTGRLPDLTIEKIENITTVKEEASIPVYGRDEPRQLLRTRNSFKEMEEPPISPSSMSNSEETRPVDTRVEKVDDPWKDLSGIQGRDVKIPGNQQALLDKESCWLPPVPGTSGPVANIPVSVAKEISEQVDRLMSHSDDVAVSQQLLAETYGDMPSPNLATSNAAEEDEDSLSDSPIPSSEWPPSSPHVSANKNRLPPDSSPVTPQAARVVRDQDKQEQSPSMTSTRSPPIDVALDNQAVTPDRVKPSSRSPTPGTAQADWHRPDLGYSIKVSGPSKVAGHIPLDCSAEFHPSNSDEVDDNEASESHQVALEIDKLAKETGVLDQNSHLSQPEEVLSKKEGYNADRVDVEMIASLETNELSLPNTGKAQIALPDSNQISSAQQQDQLRSSHLLQDIVNTDAKDNVLIEIDSDTSVSSDSELEMTAPNALPGSFRASSHETQTTPSALKGCNVTLQVDRTPYLIGKMPSRLPASVGLSTEPSDSRLGPPDLGQAQRDPIQDETLVDVVIPGTFEPDKFGGASEILAISGDVKEDSGRNKTMCTPENPPLENYQRAQSATNDGPSAKTHPKSQSPTNGKRKVAESDGFPADVTSRQKRVRMPKVKFAQPGSDRPNLALQTRAYRREVFAASRSIRQASKRQEEQVSVSNSPIDDCVGNNEQNTNHQASQQYDKFHIGQTSSPPASKSNRVSPIPSGNSKDNSGSLSTAVATSTNQASQALTSPPPSEHEMTIFGPSMHSAIFRRFKDAYPEYHSKEKHFLAMCRKIEMLEKEGRMEHKSLWDDFIMRHQQEYRQYILDCTEQAENPLPYETYYRNEIEEPLFTKRIVTPATLSDALSSAHVEKRNLQSAETEGYQSATLSTPTRQGLKPLSATASIPPDGVDLTKEEPPQQIAPQPEELSPSKSYKSPPPPVPWMKSQKVDNDSSSSKNSAQKTPNKPLITSTAPSISNPFKQSAKPSPLIAPLSSSLQSSTTPSPAAATPSAPQDKTRGKASETAKKVSSTKARSDRPSFRQPPSISPLSGPDVRTMKVKDKGRGRASPTLTPPPAAAPSPRADLPDQWWRDPINPFKSFARADAAIRCGNGNAFANMRVELVTENRPVVENGIVKAKSKKLDVLDWHL